MRHESPHSGSTTVSGSHTGHRKRLGRWWKRQSPARQDRFAMLGPLLSVLLFLAAITVAFWYLRVEEAQRETEAVKRDIEVAQQQLRLRLLESQEQLLRMAREIATKEVDQFDFLGQAATFLRERPEVISLSWIGPNRQRRASYALSGGTINSSDTPDDELLQGEPAWTFEAARDLRQPVYSRPYYDNGVTPALQVQVPLIDKNEFAGTVMAEYAIEPLLRYYVPTEVTARNAVSLLTSDGALLASTVAPTSIADFDRSSLTHEVAVGPVGNSLILRGVGYRTSVGLISNNLFWMVAALSALTVWMLLGTWRHTRRRQAAQTALIEETNFRRAMENSMLTGMRAMDMEGRITYVNPAFCSMTGYNEDELIDQTPPFPYWPPDRVEENMRLLEQELVGRTPPGGLEIKVQRRDGSQFDSRMYVSPLIDARGQQTGWMTSMTNITEAKRVRDQLAASHERFTTVLEGLEAAVSVVSVHQGELLFANRSYRLWFGSDARGHTELAGDDMLPWPAGVHHVTTSDDEGDLIDSYGGLPTPELTAAGSDPKEVFVESLKCWFDVRARYLQWTDGRLVQMLIATDITARRHAEEQAAQQAERAQITSRLVTMGEMASSVAHELNQPLTAISNYCSGMLSRLQSGNLTEAELATALDKTARQAQRAGQIIQRIRAFVKRSEPHRQSSSAAQIIDNALELAQIELKRRRVELKAYVAQRLPPLMVDPILIEQVVLNLLKNAAEAIDGAQRPPGQRRIELTVVPRHDPEGETIEFSVTDTGPGMDDEVMARLYEAFFSTKSDGLGIGLGLCRSIVEFHRGRMRAENIYNGDIISGSRFIFSLPVESAAILERTH